MKKPYASMRKAEPTGTASTQASRTVEVMRRAWASVEATPGDGTTFKGSPASEVAADDARCRYLYPACPVSHPVGEGMPNAAPCKSGFPGEDAFAIRVVVTGKPSSMVTLQYLHAPAPGQLPDTGADINDAGYFNTNDNASVMQGHSLMPDIQRSLAGSPGGGCVLQIDRSIPVLSGLSRQEVFGR